MEGFHSLRIEDKWLLAIMNLFPYIQGRTRLQKFGMLSFYEVLKDEKFFDDWKPDKYGGFSPRLANSLERLERCGYVQSDKIIVGDVHLVDRYSLTEKGRQMIKKFEANSLELEKIKSILSGYFSCPLDVLLKDVYAKYPELTINSKIIADVNKTTELDPYEEHESKSQFQGETEDEIHALTSTSQHVFGDKEFREKLAKLIGLEKVPDLDPQSFNRIKGILSEHVDARNFDAKEAVREARGC